MRYYFYENISQLIKTLYRNYSTFDPFAIADYFGIEYKFIETSDAFHGETSYILEKPLVLINAKYIDSPYRFVVMAHELYHAIEHPGLVSYYTLGVSQKNKLEYEANKFAAALLLNLYTERTGNSPMYLENLKNEFGIGDEFDEFYF